LASLFLALPSFAGWHSYAWENYRYGTNHAPVVTQIWATVHSVVVTNYVTNSPVLTTNNFINDAQFWRSTTGNVSGTKTITAYSNGAATTWTYSYSLPLVATNAALQAREIVGRDSFGAVKERTESVSSNAGVVSALASFPYVYRSERDQLIFVKQWIIDYAANFVNVTASTNRDFYVDYFKTNSSGTIPMLSATSVIALVNAPTNYLTYTPWRELWPIDSGRVSVSTCLVTFANATTSAVTNAFIDCCGHVNSLVLTNGQVGTIICTNDYIQAGRTAADYGWKYITNIFALLVHTYSENYAPTEKYQSVNYDIDTGPPCESLSDSDAAVSAAFNNQTDAGCGGTIDPMDNRPFLYTTIGSLARYYCQTLFTSGSGTQSANGMLTSGMFLRHLVGGASTSITHVADLYVSVSTNIPLSPASTNMFLEYDDYGQGFTTNYTVFGSITAAGNTTNAILIGEDPAGAQSIPPAPSTPPNNTLAIRGHDTPVSRWIIRWNVSGGFDYK
jgi:hypothetical protein